VFVHYSYADQRGVSNPAVQLPAEPWARQPKIPGRITSAISIEKEGRGSIHRILRVEGMRAGQTGFWQRDIAAPPSVGWTFVPTGLPLAGTPLANPPGNTPGRSLGPSEDTAYALRAGSLSGTIPDFNVYCSPARLELRLDADSSVSLTLHSTDTIRQTPRARGLNSDPRLLAGTIQAGDDVLHSADPDVRAFVARYLDGRFTDAPIQATATALRFPDQGWTFRRAG
jgi:hypothetical protein